MGEIGVVSSGLGTAAAVLMDGERRVLVGHDASVKWIDVETFAVVSSHRLSGVFFDFLASGAVKWAVNSDVVVGMYTDADGDLVLSEMDGPRLVVSLASGAVPHTSHVLDWQI